MLGVSFLVFASLYIVPGDRLTAITGGVPITEDARARITAEYGFDRPFLEQFASFLTRAAQGDLGYSYRYDLPVVSLILNELPSTIALMVAAMSFAIIIGGGLGILAATRRGQWPDATAMGLATIGLSLPTFWLGLMLLIVFSVGLHLVPAIGSGTPQQLILPALVLGLAPAAVIARFVRGSMLDVLHQDYVWTARSKGVSEQSVVIRHALRNAAIPVLTVVGIQIGTMLAGAVVVETVFTRHGIGTLLLQAINNRDFPVVQGTVLFITLSYVTVNLGVDVLYAVVDPRIRVTHR
jgi:ABC-type dipeptide/oligopeptide/nickel transport system permease component